MSAVNVKNNFWKKLLGHEMVRTFGIYTGSSMLNKAIPFLLMPLMTTYLSPTEYGILSVYHAIVLFAVPFIGMSIQNIITKEFYKVPREELARLISNLIFVITFSSTFVLAAIIVYSLFFPSLQGIPVQWLFPIPLIAFLNMINNFNLTILRNEQKAFTYAGFEVVGTLLQLSLSIFFVVILKVGWEGRIYPTWITAIIFGCVGLVFLVKNNYVKYNYNPARIKAILKLSIPFIPYSLGATIILFSSRFFIDHFHGKAAVGIYSVGYSFGMIVTLFKDASTKAWSPWLYRNLAHITEEGRIKIVRAIYMYMVTGILLALSVTFASYFLIHHMANPRYLGAKDVIIWLTLANAVNGMYGIMMPFAVHVGKTRALASIMFLAAAVNVIGNLVLVPIYGAVGSAQATLLAFCVSFLVNWRYVHIIYPLPWFDRRVFSFPNLGSKHV